MARNYPGHDGLQVVDYSQHQAYDHGKQHFPHSDKQVVTKVVEEKQLYASETRPPIYEKGDDAVYSEKQRRRYCGLKRRTFLVALAVILVIVAAAAIGGGVGGAMSNRSAASTPSISPMSTVTSSSRTTVSSSAPAATATTVTNNGMGAYNCPAENGTTYTSSLYPQSFRIMCDTDWPSGMTGFYGNTVVDLNTGVIATSIQACIDQCAANNAGGGQCSAVSYGANITMALARGGIKGNCFMKNQRGASDVRDSSGQAVSAFLLSR